MRSVIANYLSRDGFTTMEAGSVADGIKWLKDEFDVVVTLSGFPTRAATSWWAQSRRACRRRR